MEEKEIQQRFHLLHQEVEAAIALVEEVKLTGAAATESAGAIMARGRAARIHRQNLINFGILPLTFAHPDDWNRIAPEHVLRLPDVRAAIQRGNHVQILNQSTGDTCLATHDMTDCQVEMLLAGSLINLFRARQAVHGA